jgi:hypothetical protein
MNYPQALTISELKSLLEEAEQEIGGNSLVYFWNGDNSETVCARQKNTPIKSMIGQDGEKKSLGLETFNIDWLNDSTSSWMHKVNS